METVFIIASVTSVIFFIFNLVEEKFIKNNEEVNYKGIFRNSLLIFISNIIAVYGYEQIIPMTQMVTKNEVFVTKPEF